MSTYALINVSTGIVESMILWDGTEESGWYPPDGYTAIQTDTAGIGWSYTDSVFTKPPEELPSIPAPTKDQVELFRLKAYADPVTGSDRYFSEAVALQAEGFAATSTEVKDAKAIGLARKLEIKALYPYPVI